ncbi:MAG: hypothetical protein IMW89_22755 [Ktedonobacteraceae bacterium]|nr:hypothetical protein [Ktedonobacteraceae bacterium]
MSIEKALVLIVWGRGHYVACSWCHHQFISLARDLCRFFPAMISKFEAGANRRAVTGATRKTVTAVPANTALIKRCAQWEAPVRRFSSGCC